MQTLVVFDIGSNRLRAKIENACRDYGLERAQFSAFIGELPPARRARLSVRLLTLVTQHKMEEKEEQKEQALLIQMYPICASDFDAAVSITREGLQKPEVKQKPQVLVL